MNEGARVPIEPFAARVVSLICARLLDDMLDVTLHRAGSQRGEFKRNVGYQSG